MTSCDWWTWFGCWWGTRDYKWNNNVPYSFDASVSVSDKLKIGQVITDWNSRVAYPKFIPNETASERVVFKTDPNLQSCGRAGFTGNPHMENPVVFNPGIESTLCGRSLGLVQHEMGHVVGLIHEHQRCDRDEFVSFGGIKPFTYCDLSKDSEDTVFINKYRILSAYDFNSVMHYGRLVGVYGKQAWSITSPYLGDPSETGPINQGANGLNENDIKGIGLLYSYR